MMKTLAKYFIQGLFYSAPIVITLYVVFQSINFLDHLIPVSIPGLGILIIISLVTTVGYVGSVVLESSIGSLTKHFEKVIFRIPLIKMIYSAIKDLISALTGSSSSFEQAVLVKLDNSGNLEKIGFVTKDDLQELGISKDKVAVYFPFSYGIMGELLIVPRSAITPIDKKSAEIMKFIVSGGVVQVDNKKD